ncbi:MAG: HNH endonuclease, partial [Lachnospiraceae bacterium]|nr:HNH endonuclease [Lachnospiraceae bacterium]
MLALIGILYYDIFAEEKQGCVPFPHIFCCRSAADRGVDFLYGCTGVRKVVQLAAGVYQLCNKPAPFYNKSGEAYLECHHVEWIARGGADEVYNAGALCPNCHRKMHVLDEPDDIAKLKDI